MIKFILKIVRLVAAACITLIAWQYLQVKKYDYAKPVKFSGSELYNPYSKNDHWLKGNFHAHSHAWMGITNGKQTPKELVNAYLQFGYDIAGLSNYQQINDAIYTPGNIAVPAYEHGLNVTKTHQLVIGSHTVTYYNIMLWQNTDTRQYVLERLNKNGGIISVNHPFMNNGHPEKDFEKLSGYNCLEVINRDRVSDKHWDIALSNGKPSWILADDDCHDVNGHEFLRAWTLVQTNEKTESAVLNAIRYGKTIGVCRTKTFADEHGDSLKQFILNNKGNVIDSIITNGVKATYYLNTKVKKITLTTDNGKVVATAIDTNRIAYTLQKNETYLRAKLETGELDIYLNPLIRFDGINIPSNPLTAQENYLQTWLVRLLTMAVYAIILLVLIPGRILIPGRRKKITGTKRH